MNLSRLRKLKYALPLAVIVMAMTASATTAKPTAAGTPIKIAILSDCKGAFVGALAYVYINDRLAETDFSVGGFQLGTFNSLIGIIFLVIVLVSPDGLLGLWERLTDRLQRRPAAVAAAGD